MTAKLQKLPFLIASLCAVWGHAAHAANELPSVVVKETQETGGSYEATRSSVATKTAVPLRDVPQSVNVVTQSVMRDQNALSLQDSLANVAGVSFSIGDAQRDQVSIRGFTAINDQFVDGVRDDALYYRDLSNIERIEVLKGPSSVLYGRGSAGGLINRVTKKPQANPVTEVAATVGSRGQRRGEFDLGAANADNTVLFRLTGAAEDSTSFRNQFFLERQAIAPSVLFKLSPQTQLLLQADYLNDKRLADQGVPSLRGRPVDVPVSTYYGAANGKDRAYVQSEVASTTATLDHEFGTGMKLHSVLRAYDYSLDRNYTTISRVNATANPTVTVALNNRLRDESGFYLQNELTQKLQWGGTEHHLLYGLELGRQRKSEISTMRNNAATYDLFNPVLVDMAPLASNLPRRSDNRTRIHIAGLYLQDQITLTPQWKLLGGVRYDSLKQDRDDLTATNQDLQRTDHTLAPRLGVVYQPTETLSFYASYSQSFQPIAESYVFRGNSDQLKPTETENKEVGVKMDVGASASLTASVFEMSQTNIQVQDPNNTTFALPVGKQRTRGMELTYNGRLGAQWEITGGYAYLDGKISRSTELTSAGTPFQGNTAALTPRHSVTLWVKHKLPGGYYVAAGGRAESARFASSDNLTTLPGYGVIHLGAGYESKQFDITATVKNAANRKYYASAHSGANDYNMPGEPLSLVIGARYRF